MIKALHKLRIQGTYFDSIKVMKISQLTVYSIVASGENFYLKSIRR